MSPAASPSQESGRIEFLLQRDGYRRTREWVERTRDIYRAALSPGQHGAELCHRREMEQSIAEFEDWLASHP